MTMDDACRYVRASDHLRHRLRHLRRRWSDLQHGADGQHRRHDILRGLHRERRPDQRVESQRSAVLGLDGDRGLTREDDATPPQISAVSAGQPAAAAATITWTTDESATSQVEYGTTTEYGSETSLDSSLANSHSQLVSGLVAATAYHFRVLAVTRPAISRQARTHLHDGPPRALRSTT